LKDEIDRAAAFHHLHHRRDMSEDAGLQRNVETLAQLFDPLDQ
jgi:hypothetical protein